MNNPIVMDFSTTKQHIFWGQIILATFAGYIWAGGLLLYIKTKSLDLPFPLVFISPISIFGIFWLWSIKKIWQTNIRAKKILPLLKSFDFQFLNFAFVAFIIYTENLDWIFSVMLPTIVISILPIHLALRFSYEPNRLRFKEQYHLSKGK